MIIYFTGTGNSRYVAQALAHYIGDEAVDIFEYLRSGESPEMHSERPWVFVSPVYGWRLPRVFNDWIERSGFSGSNTAYFVMTCGSEIGNAGSYLRALCRKKGFDLRGVGEIVMPENYIAMFDAPGEETSEKLRRHALRAIKRMSALIADGKTLPAKKLTFADRFKSSVINPAFYAACVKSKAFRATEACVSCAKCAVGCPVGGIRMKDDKPEWTGACTHCMACICGCPAGAIEYGKKSVGKVRYQCPDFEPEPSAEKNGTVMKYDQEFTLCDDDFDSRGNVFPSKVLDIFQTLANKHAEVLGVGFEAMLEKNLLWVITQIKYQVCGTVKPGQKLIGETWPLPPARIGFVREYLIRDDQGNILIKGTSNWVQIDTVKRQLAPNTNVYPDGEYCTVQNFTERVRRLRDFEAASEAYQLRPDESTIDRNGHVNNTKYADFALAALGGLGGVIDTFQTDYINEVMAGELLSLYHAPIENGVTVKGLSETEKRMFTCVITYR